MADAALPAVMSVFASRRCGETRDNIGADRTAASAFTGWRKRKITAGLAAPDKPTVSYAERSR